MSFLFKRETPEEMLKKNQRALNKAMRDLDRERSQLEQQEKKVILDIKKMAKLGQMVTNFTKLYKKNKKNTGSSNYKSNMEKFAKVSFFNALNSQEL
jgi:hypothetical protein